MGLVPVLVPVLVLVLVLGRQEHHHKAVKGTASVTSIHRSVYQRLTLTCAHPLPSTPLLAMMSVAVHWAVGHRRSSHR
jgi:hypothetical protein